MHRSSPDQLYLVEGRDKDGSLVHRSYHTGVAMRNRSLSDEYAAGLKVSWRDLRSCSAHVQISTEYDVKRE